MKAEELLARLAPPHPEPVLKRQDTALLLVDMQKMSGVDRAVYKAAKMNIPESTVRETLQDMDRRFKEAIRNTAQMLQVCRQKNMTIAHTKIEAKTKDCRDVGKNHRLHGHLLPVGSEWAEFYEEVAPVEGEIVMSKTCSSFFSGTSIDRVLRYIGIENVIVVGFYTEQCVSSTVREACDHGYYVYAVSDGTATGTQATHDYELAVLSNRYAKIVNTQEILERLMAL
jgi:nicotinamidase-related amidase